MILKRHAKKVLAGLFALVVAFTMTGCGSNPLLKAYQDALTEANTTLATAKDLVAIPNASEITSNLVLPNKVVRDDWEVTVTWASNNPTVITTAGVVTRQTTNTNVTMTATLKYLYNYGGTDTPAISVVVADTKVFNLTVLAEPVLDVISVAAALASPNATSVSSPKVLVEGVVVGVNNTADVDGFFISDGTAIIYVYSSSNVALGDLVRVNAHKMIAFDQPQIAERTATSSTKTTGVTVLSSGHPVNLSPLHAPMSIDDLSKVLPTENPAIFSKAVRLYGKVSSEVTTSRTYYYLNDPYTGAKVIFYYKSEDIDVIADYDDEYINVIVTVKGYYASNEVKWAVTYSAAPNSLEVVTGPSDVDFVVRGLAEAQGSISTSLMALQSVTLPEEFGDVEYSYALPAGEVKATLNNNVLTAADVNTESTAELIVTATKGNVSYSMILEFTISTLADTLTIAQFTALDNDAVNFVKGDIVGTGGTAGNNYFWIRDLEGDYLKIDAALGDMEIGDRVILQATKKFTSALGTYAITPTLIGTISQENPLPADPTGTEVFTFAQLEAAFDNYALVGKYIKVTGYPRLVGSFYNLYGDTTATTSKVQLFQNSATLEAEMYGLDGLEVDVYAFVHSIGLSSENPSNIRLSIQKFVNDNPAVPLNTFDVNDITIGVGETATILPVFNDGILPRPTNRVVTYDIPTADASKLTIVDGVLSGLEPGVVTITATPDEDPLKAVTFDVTVVVRSIFTFNTVTGGSTSYNQKTVTTSDNLGVSATFDLTGVATTTYNNSGVFAMGSRIGTGYFGRTEIKLNSIVNNLTKIEFDNIWFSSNDAGRSNLVTEFKVYIATDAAFTEGVVTYDVAFSNSTALRKFSQAVTPGNYYVKIVFESTWAGTSNGCRMVIDNLTLYR